MRHLLCSFCFGNATCSQRATCGLQSSVRAINERILAVLDRSGSGRVDVGMFFAVLAPVCGGSIEKRRRLVFDILRWRGSYPREGVVPNADVKDYLKFLRAIYLPDQVGINEFECTVLSYLH